MDYRKSLVQLESWTPKLARRIWALRSVFEAPLTLALGLRVNRLSDFEAEVEIRPSRLTRNEEGKIHSAILLAAADFTSKILWERHLRSGLEGLRLESIHGRFFRDATSKVRARTQLQDTERERALRRLYSGENVEFEMSVILVDNKDQHVASINCIWKLHPLKPLSLNRGKI